MTEVLNKEFSRKSFVKGGGALIVGFSLAGAAVAGKAGAAGPTSAGYLPPENQIDSWLAINADGTVVFKTSQIEAGTGVTTGFALIVAEELDVAPSKVNHGPFDSWQVVNSGETGGSNGIQSTGGPPLRAVAAQAKQALLKLASASLGVPVAALSVSDGVVSGGGKSITYGQLVGGKLLNTTLGPATLNPGVAPAKPVIQYKVVGTNVLPRVDIPDKVTGRYTYVHNVRVPGMLHARWIRPRGQGAYGTGAKLVSYDASSIKHIQGVQIVRKADFLVVVAEKEYDAIRAAAELKVQWKDEPILPTTGNLWKQMRAHDSAGKAPARYSENVGNVDTAMKSAAKTVTGTYMYHYNGHATIGPSAAVADVGKTQAVVYSNTQKLPGMVDKLADILNMPAKDIRVIFYEGSSSYGAPQTRWDTAPAAAVISQMIGKPVRLQLMRWDEHGWDLFGPAQLMDVRGGVDAKGNIVAYELSALMQPDTSNLGTSQELLGTPYPTPGTAAPNTSNTAQGYKIPNKRIIGKTLPLYEGYLLRGNLRNPQGPQTAFAAEQLVDELAVLAGMDSIEFRRLNITDERWLGVMNATVKAASWQPHVSGSNLSDANVVTGRGFGFGRHGSAGYAAAVADIEVNKKTGKITVKHVYAGMDAGLAISPALAENQLVGATIQGVSRALTENVSFSKTRVTGLDWVSYPILRFKDTPKVTTVLVQRPDQLPLGAGEPGHPANAPAIANAFFDATGVRIREAPMTPARVIAVLKAAGKR
jgi:CO/xanthine dehydrogenase Mo-binding subunit